MALPTLEKTWIHDVNNIAAAGGGAAISYQNLMFLLKTRLISLGSSPWTVAGSSNASIAAMDGVDRWVSASDLIWTYLSPTLAHSWIVLRQTGLPGGNFQICIQLLNWTGSSPQGRAIIVYCSPSGGFAGGSTTARPTAADEVMMLSSTGGPRWHTDNTAAFQTALHVIHATDGSATRVIMCSGGISRTYINFDTVLSPAPGWSNPLIFGWNTNSLAASILTYTRYNDIEVGIVLKAYVGSTLLSSLGFTSEGFTDAMIGQKFITVANEVDGTWPLCPMGLASTATLTGRIGRLPDIYWGSAAGTITDGSTYPASGTKTFVQFGNMVFPWNGSTPVTG